MFLEEESDKWEGFHIENDKGGWGGDKMCVLGRLFHNGGNIHSNLTVFFLDGDYNW